MMVTFVTFVVLVVVVLVVVLVVDAFGTKDVALPSESRMLFSMASMMERAVVVVVASSFEKRVADVLATMDAVESEALRPMMMISDTTTAGVGEKVRRAALFSLAVLLRFMVVYDDGDGGGGVLLAFY